MLVLAGLMAMSLTACSGHSDDDVDPTQQYKNRIIGYWYSSSGSAYCFSEGGTGYYRSGDVGGDFHWTMTGLQIDMTTVVFYTPYSVWHAEPMSAMPTSKTCSTKNTVSFGRAVRSHAIAVSSRRAFSP